MDDTICAACGKGGDDLKTCTTCKAVKYCNVTCQKEHSPNHKKECKKRAAELFDEALFKQPPPKEDCSICFLPLPAQTQTAYESCCGKTICTGCEYACVVRSNDNCPFCREPRPTKDEAVERLNVRVAANDAGAIYQLGCHYMNGTVGFPQDSNKAVELFLRAVELRHKDAHAHDALAKCYHKGRGVQRDEEKAKYHWEIAAMAGNEVARYILGRLEQGDGNMNRAMKHWMIGAMAGDDPSLKAIKEGFLVGHVTKDDYEKALRAYQETTDEMKSEDRDKGAAARKR